MNQELHSISGITDPDKIKEAAELAVQRRLERFECKVVGEETLDEVIALAREDWEADAEWREIQRRRQPGGQRQEQYRPADDRLAVDFLRHQRTEYDRQLQEIQESLSELKPVDDDGENPLEHFFDDLQNRAHAAIREKTSSKRFERGTRNSLLRSPIDAIRITPWQAAIRSTSGAPPISTDGPAIRPLAVSGHGVGIADAATMSHRG